MKKIRLKGGQIQYTDRKGIAYRVDEGSVLVYIVPFKDGRPGRRMFVGEIAAPEVVPCFCHSSELYGDWMFAIAAVDTAVIVPGKVSDTDAARERFAEIAGISTGLEGGFEEAVIEKYELKRVKEKGNIYFAKADAERVRNTSFRMIYDMLGKGKRWLAGGLFTATGDQLYDAASMLCRFEKIDIAPLERIRITSGNKFRVEDIARVSHFVIREVVLTPGWNHRDNGALLVFTKDGARPLACIPDGPRRYSIYDPAEDSSFKLTDEAAAELSANAYMFYT